MRMLTRCFQGCLHIARKSVPTLPILLDLAREAYHSMPNVQRLDNIWDYRQMEMSSKSSTQQPPPVQIRERRGKMLMHFKEWPLEKVLDISGHWRHQPCRCVPKWARANPAGCRKGRKVFEAMNGDLKKWQDGGKMTEDQIKW